MIMHNQRFDIVSKSITEINKLSPFVKLTLEGFRLAENAIDWVPLLEKDKLKDYPNTKRKSSILSQKISARVEQFKQIEEFVESEKNSNYSFVYRIAIIRLWGILEAMVDDFVSTFLTDKEKLRDIIDITKIKTNYEDLREQTDYLLELIKKKLRSSKADVSGVNRFENLLNEVGYGGNVHEEVKKYMLELSQVRNILVHRDGVADNKFREKCNWIKTSSGEQINITEEMFELYLDISRWYIVEILARLDEPGSDLSRLRAYQEELIKQITNKEYYRSRKLLEVMKFGNLQRILV